MDWIDTLPEGVVCHILSFLPTKQAAVTSVLSKRWHSFWTLVPNLDIDDSVFLHPEEGKGERDPIRQSFVDFVDRILALQGDSPIEKFSLKCITYVHPDTVNRWICNVLQRGVSYLDLFIDISFEDIEDGYYLPREMFVSKTLVELNIRSERYVDWWTEGEGTFLPMLKTLDVDSELIFSGKIEMLLPSFPVLEKLRMANMVRMESDETVSSARLKWLMLSINWDNRESLKSISFDTPSLLYLNYFDLVVEDYPLVNMKNLVEARINFMVEKDQIEQARAPYNDLLANGEEAIVLPFDNVMKLMNGIQNVQRLYLTSDTLEVLYLCRKSMLVFNNVKMLGITSDEGRGWQAMPDLLRNCPNLEYLLIEGLLHYVMDKCGDFCDCIPRADKGRSLTSCTVEMLEIQGFKGTMREITMIRHFLRYFRCLEEVWVLPKEDGHTNFENPGVFELVEKILNLYDELSSCDVVFLVDNHMRRKWTVQSCLQIFTCKTIVKLKLGKGFVIPMVPESASLPALKTLFLDCILFENHHGCAFKAILSACHVLEELLIRGEGLEDWRDGVAQCHPRLFRDLPLSRSNVGFGAFDFRSIIFDIPSLSYLKYSDSVPDEY